MECSSPATRRVEKLVDGRLRVLEPASTDTNDQHWHGSAQRACSSEGDSCSACGGNRRERRAASARLQHATEPIKARQA